MGFYEELKRRNVIRVAVGYLAVGWLLLQAGALIFGALDLPNSWVRGLLAVLAVGFIPTLIFAWVYELTPEGLKRTSEVSADESVSRRSSACCSSTSSLSRRARPRMPVRQGRRC